MTRRAHFPFLKTIDDFNFTYQSTLRLHMLGSALAPDFVTEGRSLIFSGKPGRGKTHLAIAVAYRAIQNGFDAFFTTAATLIDDLSAAFRDGQLAQALQAYTHPAVLVVDEVGYLTYGTDAANMLFHVVNERHRRRRSMIFTTNKALKAWGRVLHDEDLGQAIIDRVLERGRLIRLDGPSVRTLHLKLDDALKADSDQDDEVARISGIKWPEFPEPTTAIARSCSGGGSMVLRRRTGVLTAVLLLAVVGQMHEAQARNVDVTGAWDVTITKPDGSASGLAILSQDGTKITGMIGPAVTDMMPAEGTLDGDKLTLLTRPRSGRTAAFAKCELTVRRDRMTGTIDTDKGTIEFIRKKRQNYSNR